MPSVLIAALHGSGAASNLGPLIVALRGRGHDVTMVTDPAFRARAEALGARFAPVADPALPSLKQRPATRLERIRRLRPNIRTSLLAPIPAQWAALQGVLASTPVDVVLTDVMFLGAGILAAVPTTERPPIVAIGMVPPPARDVDVAPYGSGLQPIPGTVGRLRNLALARFVTGSLLAPIDREFLAAVRACTGYDLDCSLWDLAGRAEVWAQAAVRRFDYPRSQEPANLRWVGPLRAVEPTELPDWWDPATEPPVVVVHTDGRLPLDRFVLPAIEAQQGDGSTTIVTGATRAETTRAYGGPLPSNAHFETTVPWARLVPGRTVFVGTGDYMQVQQALRHGIPVVVTGNSEPQVETKARVEWAGVGIDVSAAVPTAAAIRRAIEQVRADPGIGLAVARVAAQIERTDAESTICDIVADLTAAPTGATNRPISPRRSRSG